jgi:hypothetical protein
MDVWSANAQTLDAWAAAGAYMAVMVSKRAAISRLPGDTVLLGPEVGRELMTADTERGGFKGETLHSDIPDACMVPGLLVDMKRDAASGVLYAYLITAVKDGPDADVGGYPAVMGDPAQPIEVSFEDEHRPPLVVELPECAAVASAAAA